MDSESIIRDEAKVYYEEIIDLGGFTEPYKQINKIKSRLSDFYTTEYKAIFLDEIKILLDNNLDEHRRKNHNGQVVANCEFEKIAEKLLFYLNQELNTLPKIAHQKRILNSEQLRNSVFISYSHADTEYLTDLKRHFKPFLNQIKFWDDSNIQPGQTWKDEIKNAIDKTKVAILLISADFLGSEFITTDEIPPLLKAAEENGATILIVILKPCLFEEFNHLNQYQAMNSPDKPIIKLNYTEKEETYVNLVRQTIKLLKE